MVGLIMFRRRAPETIRTVRIKEGLFGITLFIWIVTLIPYTVSSHSSSEHNGVIN